MQDADPFQVRRQGTRRVRKATAAAAVAAVAGTGLLTWALADQAAAQSPTGGAGTVHEDGGGVGGSWSHDDVSPPGRLPGAGGTGPVHASSGGS